MATNNLQVELDEIDHELLRLLSANARMTNTDLAEAAGIAASTCITRVRALVSRGVITGFNANINPAAIGLSSQVLISVTLRAGARSHLADFMNEMRTLPEVIQVFSWEAQKISSCTLLCATTTTSANLCWKTYLAMPRWPQLEPTWCLSTFTKARSRKNFSTLNSQAALFLKHERAARIRY